MKVCVPLFPGRSLGWFRLSSAGLGNLMTIWGRTIVYATQHRHAVAWPVWPQVHVGSWLRNEPDKRSYAGIFQKPSTAISLRAARRLPRFSEAEAAAFESVAGPAALYFSRVDGDFGGLFGHHDLVWQQLRDMARSDLDAVKARSSGTVALCVRLGDFTALGWATPVTWFVDRLNEMRAFLPDVPVWIHSSGSDAELAVLLKMRNVERAPPMANTLESIALMSGSRLMIATGASTFYRWAAYLGAVPAVVHASDRWHTRFWKSLDSPSLAYFEDHQPPPNEWRTVLFPSPTHGPRLVRTIQ